ncbi:MAG: hypothetical protein ABSA13_19540 [Beijerinckiaceae bacterium]|jgi:hypothetical protein
MTAFKHARALTAALTGLAMAGSTTLAFANIKDYEFQLVEKTVKAGPSRLITVRLVNTKAAAAVTNSGSACANSEGGAS